MANSLWGQDGAPLQAEFLDLVARHYGGEHEPRRFPPRCRDCTRTINRWVEDKTKQKIRELIPSGGLDAERAGPGERGLLQGDVGAPVRKAATRDEPFTVEGGGTGGRRR